MNNRQMRWLGQMECRDVPYLWRLAILVLGLIAAAPSWLTAEAAEAVRHSSAEDRLDHVERRIAKEPRYGSTPRYALLVFGAGGASRIWVVEDGTSLYLDRNGNGDLTDDGPPIRPTNVKALGQRSDGTVKQDFDYVLDELTLSDGSRHTQFRLARWSFGDGPDEYGLRIVVDGKTPMYAGWIPFWGTTAQTAPVIHLGGRLQPLILRHKEFVRNSGTGRLSIAFINPGVGEGAHARLSIDALPEDVIPVVEIDWPVPAGAPAIRTTHRLTARCCYWEFYNPEFTVPAGIIAGTATVTVSMDGGKFPLGLADDTTIVRVRDSDSVRAD